MTHVLDWLRARGRCTDIAVAGGLLMHGVRTDADEVAFESMVSSFDPQNDSEFDAFVGSYRDMHAAVLGASGEEPEYFARYKLEVLRDILGLETRPLLDFGCGIGNLTRLLGDLHTEIHGYDPSSRSVELARERAEFATFHDDLGTIPRDTFGTVVLANVLHHVPPSERPGVIAGIVPLLGAGGRIVVFEHNRWNPLTVRAVRRCEFDVGVSLLSKPELGALLKHSGLEDVRSRFVVFFPSALRSLRSLEPKMGFIPLGAQVCVSARRD